MSKTITLNKATRVEGNADIHIEVDKGRVKAARFMVHDFRGFEKFVQGRKVEYMPQLVSRICGLCSCAHQIASLRAIEDAMSITPTPSLDKLREIIGLGELMASHALSYFYLSMPDLVGAKGGVFELVQSHPLVMKEAFALRKAGQNIVTLLGKRAVHPVSMGVGRFLKEPTREELRKVKTLAEEIRDRSAALIVKAGANPLPRKQIDVPDGQRVNFVAYEQDTGRFQVFGRNGEWTDNFSAAEFEDNVAEMRAEWTFSKFPYLSKYGFPEGIMLVGPLSRCLLPGGMLDDPDVRSFELASRIDRSNPSLETYDTCRLLEIFWSAKKVLAYLKEINPDDVTMKVDTTVSGRGIGVIEAPRGILVHSYLINQGCIERVNMLVATQFNNPFINLLIKDMAENHLQGDTISEEGDRMIGRCIRIFDPCLSCATH